MGMCHCNRCIILLGGGGVNNGGDNACGGTVAYEKSPNLLLKYAVDFQTALKIKYLNRGIKPSNSSSSHAD